MDVKSTFINSYLEEKIYVVWVEVIVTTVLDTLGWTLCSNYYLVFASGVVVL